MTSHRILLSLIICLTLIACARPRVVVGSDAGMADASFPDGYTNDAIVTDASLDSSVSVDASVLQDAMPDVLDMSTTPTLVDSVECGAGHTCAILDDGTVACWGKNYNYQLGIGTRGVGIAVLSFDVAARAEQVAVGEQRGRATWYWQRLLTVHVSSGRSGRIATRHRDHRWQLARMCVAR
ncbi:MAG: hypothetical protein IPK60_24740 [Sandaracinaceae bacterium]|nr:hypothetical protein [Sandaracinaceae bacterium]